MTGVGHYLEAERLLEHAAAMLDADYDPEHAEELIQRQLAAISAAQAHATLALASAHGLTADLRPEDMQAWHKAAAIPIEG